VAIFQSGSSKPGHIVHIDLIEGDSTTCGPATRGGPSPNKGTGTSGAAADVAAKMKGKCVVAAKTT
jgi:hypothetical protein